MRNSNASDNFNHHAGFRLPSALDNSTRHNSNHLQLDSAQSVQGFMRPDNSCPYKGTRAEAECLQEQSATAVSHCAGAKLAACISQMIFCSTRHTCVTQHLPGAKDKQKCDWQGRHRWWYDCIARGAIHSQLHQNHYDETLDGATLLLYRELCSKNIRLQLEKFQGETG